MYVPPGENFVLIQHCGSKNDVFLIHLIKALIYQVAYKNTLDHICIKIRVHCMICSILEIM
jgi:hypothetical protein